MSYFIFSCSLESVLQRILLPHQPKKVGCAIAIVLAAVIAVPVYKTFIKQEPKVISVQEYKTAVFSGFNGEGTVDIVTKAAEDEELDDLLNSGTCTVNPKEKLKNGEEITISCVYENNGDKYILENTEYSVTVAGLKEYLTIDLFYGVDVQWEVNEQEKTVNPAVIVPEDDSLRSQVTYTIADQDEEGNVTVHAEADEAWFKERGYQIVDDGLDKTFAIGEMPDVYASEKAACTSKGGKWNDTAKSCVIPEPVVTATHSPEQTQESQSEPVADQQVEQQAETYQAPANNIMSLAQSYVGRGGTCDQISWDFIRDLYGVDISWGQNVYWVPDLQPGDTVRYYSSEDGRWKHVAVYLGNGLVLSGNYGDGVAHIVGLNDSSYTQKDYWRVAR